MIKDILEFEEIKEVQVSNAIWIELIGNVWFARKEDEPKLVLEDQSQKIFMTEDLDYCNFTITLSLFEEIKNLFEKD